MAETKDEEIKEPAEEPCNAIDIAASYLQKNTRPLLAAAAYIALCVLAYMSITGRAQGLPGWFNEAFVVLSIGMCGGWEIVRELWKRKTGA